VITGLRFARSSKEGRRKCAARWVRGTGAQRKWSGPSPLIRTTSGPQKHLTVPLHLSPPPQSSETRTACSPAAAQSQQPAAGKHPCGWSTAGSPSFGHGSTSRLFIPQERERSDILEPQRGDKPSAPRRAGPPARREWRPEGARDVGGSTSLSKRITPASELVA